MIALLVDPFLGTDRNRLVGGQCVNGKKAGGMPGQPIDGHHFDPGVHRIELLPLFAQLEVVTEGADFPQGVGVVEHEEVFGELVVPMERNLMKSGGNFVQLRGSEPGEGKDLADRTDVAGPRDTSEQGSLDGSGAAPGEGIVNNTLGGSEQFDEEPGELGFEASPVGDFMQCVGGTLFGSPELVDEDGDWAGRVIWEEGRFDFLGRGAEISERTKDLQEFDKVFRSGIGIDARLLRGDLIEVEFHVY